MALQFISLVVKWKKYIGGRRGVFAFIVTRLNSHCQVVCPKHVEEVGTVLDSTVFEIWPAYYSLASRRRHRQTRPPLPIQ
jgi:hypothetical protein